jgi:sterol desaturase/sphingolipid hydroxylase (fatty acid hydroxylase superfamily)
MEIITSIIDQFKGFFNYRGLFELIEKGDYSVFLTYDGIVSLIAPLFPVILALEFIRGVVFSKLKVIDYKISFFTYVFNSIIGRFISIGMTMYCIGLLEGKSLWILPLNAWGFVLGYVAWEFGHFWYHFLAHKVRLFWCLHSTHHAPSSMNLSISWAHFFLEAPYADIIRTSICMVLGVPPVMLFAIMFIDGTWGSFIHIGESLMKKADLGVLGKFILTPSHHRVHHAKNLKYMDTNYCNLLNIWDRIFKTYQPEIEEEKIVYGITRDVDPGNFSDAYFGEIVLLAKDVFQAPGIVNKVKYLFMPPGWSHSGEHKTVSALRIAEANNNPSQ